MKLIAPGSPVRFVDSGIAGRVMSINIDPGPHIEYKVRMWADENPRAEWFEAFEVEPTNGEKITVGFEVGRGID